ncbi:hypothetical protein CH330_04565 [candidate division WOR-3 bacterium JGI_Cruoil_03_51_56]|uniref:Uncharacterized protein n=1 Tax=candidate division WOR-3 bacterium JGI_Cruoil_03_51_56 TaxID=1973747 RepID=A0A235BUG6_UNCW3|nr:MAG: hypothetical protein CH330_04565 [candidate division WOR-3 bacterium JGI_Cruoil_03_51_56]
MNILGRRIKRKTFYGLVVPAVALLIGIIVSLVPFSQTASKRQMEKLQQEQAKSRAELAGVRTELGRTMEYLDGLPKAKPAVRKPFEKGYAAMRGHRWDEAIGYFVQAMRKASGTQLVALFNLMGLCHYTPGRLKQALETYEWSARIARRLNDKEGKAAALGNIALIYRAKGELDKALDYAKEGLRIQREIGDRRNEVQRLMAIGLLLADSGKLDEAQESYDKALTIHRAIDLRKDEATALGNIALIYRAKGELDKAFSYQQDALKIDREIGNKQGEASDLGNIGLIYRDRGELDKALGCLLQVYAIFSDIGARPEVARTLRNLAKLHKQMGHERFLAGCVKSGMSREEAEEIAKAMEKSKGK